MRRILLATLALAIVGAAAVSAPARFGVSVVTPRDAAVVSAQSLATAPTIADVADRGRPAVVFIAVQTAPVRGAFGIQPSGGVGSGAIFHPAGYIVTNNHVVEGAQQLRVALPDGRAYGARLVGRDVLSDLAVIKIDPKPGEPLPTLRFGDSSRLKVGEWVVAIGNALGLEGGPTVSAGVVSALGRDVAEPNGSLLENVIQTDAAINPGNSGGPLLNMDAEIVGINTLGAGRSSSGFQAQGINFAISTSIAQPIVDDIVATGRVSRAYLGVTSVTFTAALSAETGIAFVPGVLVLQVGASTPAARAGIQPGDVIVEFGGAPIMTDRELRQQILARRPGDTVAIGLRRAGQIATLSARLVERPN